MSSRTLKPWLLIALIFLVGVGTGVLLTIAFQPHFMGPPSPMKMREMWMHRLSDRLELTDDQKAKVQPILDKAAQDMQGVHRDEVKRVGTILLATEDQLSSILTPEQKAELQKMKGEREKLFSNHLHLWGRPDGPPHGHGGPPPGDMPPPPDQSPAPASKP